MATISHTQASMYRVNWAGINYNEMLKRETLLGDRWRRAAT